MKINFDFSEMTWSVGRSTCQDSLPSGYADAILVNILLTAGGPCFPGLSMNLTFAEKRLTQLCVALKGVGLPAHEISFFSGDEDDIDRHVDLFSFRIPSQVSGQYGVKMDGIGIMSVVAFEEDSNPVVIRKVTSVSQAVDILMSFAQNALNIHLMRAAA